MVATATPSSPSGLQRCVPITSQHISHGSVTDILSRHAPAVKNWLTRFGEHAALLRSMALSDSFSGVVEHFEVAYRLGWMLQCKGERPTCFLFASSPGSNRRLSFANAPTAASRVLAAGLGLPMQWTASLTPSSSLPDWLLTCQQRQPRIN